MSLLKYIVKIKTSSKKRLGRGYSSGKGHTSTRGNKGHLARTGGKTPIWFEGGQLPIIKKMPMIRGKGRFKVLYPIYEVSLSDISKIDKVEITIDTLKLYNLIPKNAKKVKIIRKGGLLNKKVIIKGVKVSRGAKDVIEKSGGKVL